MCRWRTPASFRKSIGQLCYQFKLPSMGAPYLVRFTAAGHGDALPIFLEVREQEPEDRTIPTKNRPHRQRRLFLLQ